MRFCFSSLLRCSSSVAYIMQFTHTFASSKGVHLKEEYIVTELLENGRSDANKRKKITKMG